MGLAANALLSVEDVRSYLNLPDAEAYPAIEFLIDSVSNAIETYCARTFRRLTYSQEKYDGTGERWILLRNYPVESISAVDFLDSDYPESWSSALLDANILVDPESLRLVTFRAKKFPYGIQNVRISYIAGYTSTPPNLKQAALELVAVGYRMADKHLTGIDSVSIAGQTTKFSTGAMPPETREKLDPFRRVA